MLKMPWQNQGFFGLNPVLSVGFDRGRVHNHLYYLKLSFEFISLTKFEFSILSGLN